MVDSIKLLVSVIVALMESLPQTGPTGTIPDAAYNTLIADAVVGVAAGAGFQLGGFTDAQVRGAAGAIVTVVRAWQAAPRS